MPEMATVDCIVTLCASVHIFYHFASTILPKLKLSFGSSNGQLLGYLSLLFDDFFSLLVGLQFANLSVLHFIAGSLLFLFMQATYLSFGIENSSVNNPVGLI